MEKLTKDFVSLRGDTFQPVALFRELAAGLPADTPLLDGNWRINEKFFEQCEVADPIFNRYEVEPGVRIWLTRAVDSLPNDLLDEIYFHCFGSRIWHSSDWKLMRYLEKWDLEAILDELLPLVYVSIFERLKESYHNYRPSRLRKSILRKFYDMLDDNGVFTVSDSKSMQAMAKAIVWWCHDPVVIEEFQLLRKAVAIPSNAAHTRELIHNALLRLVMCAAGTVVVWTPEMRDE